MILVLALGNPLRGDDGVGPAAVEGLALHGAEVVVAHQLLPEHAELLAGAALAIFVDAREGPSPGAVREEVLAPGGDAPLSHQLAPGHLLALARALHGRAPAAVAMTVDGAEFGHGGGLSPEVRAAVPALRARIEALAGACVAADAS